MAEEGLDDGILPSKRAEWREKQNKDSQDNFRADTKTTFFPCICCSKHEKRDKREAGLFRCTERLCLCSKIYFCCDGKSQKYKFSSKGLNKRALEDSGDGPIAKY